MSYFTLQPAKIGTGSEDERGLLVLVDDHIVAILVKLEARYHNQARGQWFLEAGFGWCAATPPAPFRRVSDGLAWIAGRLGRDATSLRCELNAADRAFSPAAAGDAKAPPARRGGTAS